MTEERGEGKKEKLYSGLHFGKEALAEEGSAVGIAQNAIEQAVEHLESADTEGAVDLLEKVHTILQRVEQLDDGQRRILEMSESLIDEAKCEDRVRELCESGEVDVSQLLALLTQLEREYHELDAEEIKKDAVLVMQKLHARVFKQTKRAKYENAITSYESGQVQIVNFPFKVDFEEMPLVSAMIFAQQLHNKKVNVPVLVQLHKSYGEHLEELRDALSGVSITFEGQEFPIHDISESRVQIIHGGEDGEQVAALPIDRGQIEAALRGEVEIEAGLTLDQVKDLIEQERRAGADEGGILRKLVRVTLRGFEGISIRGYKVIDGAPRIFFSHLPSFVLVDVTKPEQMALAVKLHGVMKIENSLQLVQHNLYTLIMIWPHTRRLRNPERYQEALMGVLNFNDDLHKALNKIEEPDRSRRYVPQFTQGMMRMISVMRKVGIEIVKRERPEPSDARERVEPSTMRRGLSSSSRPRTRAPRGARVRTSRRRPTDTSRRSPMTTR